jgi:hypothetical protein
LRLRPDYALAHLNYAVMLAAQGRANDARSEAEAAGRSSDPAVRENAQKLLTQIGRSR